MTTWNPGQYLKFSDLRLQPALDLLARIEIAEPKSIFDLGCGPGTVTSILAEHWPDASVTGLDQSPEMLDEARKSGGNIIWRQIDIADWSPQQPADIIFSNAALHWLDGHPVLLPRLLGCLNSGGVLAVQMPNNYQAPSHTCIADAVQGGPWVDLLQPLLRRSPVADADDYQTILSPVSASLDIWEKVYQQQLRGDDPVLDWLMGTALKPFLDILDQNAKSGWKGALLADCAARLGEAYPKRADGITEFPFRRLFMVATKA